MNAYKVTDELWLWWLADPARARSIRTLRHVRRGARQSGGVSLEYRTDWQATGQALSEDLPLQAGEFLPVEPDAAAGAVDVNAAQRYRLSPAFDVLPAGQALGYQQMRVGRDGADSTIDNALSEHRAFALTHAKAQEVAAEVARAVSGWRAHFKRKRVAPRDLQLLGEQIDRPFLREQRAQWR